MLSKLLIVSIHFIFIFYSSIVLGSGIPLISRSITALIGIMGFGSEIDNGISDKLSLSSVSISDSDSSFPSVNSVSLKEIKTRDEEMNEDSIDFIIVNKEDDQVKESENQFIDDQSISISPSLKRWNFHDSDRVKAINEILCEISNVPSLSKKACLVLISQLISSYEHATPLEDLNEKIMKRLQITNGQNGEILNFYSENFANQLGSLLSQVSIPWWDHFWNEITRFIFKWMIYRREETASSKNDKFKKSCKSIKSLISMIAKKSLHHIPSDFNLKSMDFRTFSKFEELIKVEFLENPHIFPLFASAIKKFYNGNPEIEDGESGKCKELENDVFNGNYNQNILLKYLVVMFDPKGQMRRCIIRSDQHASRLSAFKSISNEAITRNYLLNLESKGPKALHLADISFINKFIVDFYLSSGKKFQIENPSQLIFLLKRFLKEGLLIRKIVEETVGFKSFPFNPNKPFQWNQKTFEEYINSHNRNSAILPGDFAEYKKFLELFDLKPQIEKSELSEK